MTWKIIKLSLKGIYNNKMRSFLTMLGIIIGVMAVVILVSITQGRQAASRIAFPAWGRSRLRRPYPVKMFPFQPTMWRVLLPIPQSAAWLLLFPQTKP